MKIIVVIILFTTMTALTYSQSTNSLLSVSKKSHEIDSTNGSTCDYIEHFKNLGNTSIDTIRVGQRLIDPIDDSTSFEKTKFDFFIKKNKIYKIASTPRQCDGKFISVEYYQDFSKRIDLKSYREFNDTYFTTGGEVYFWYLNSCGHLMLPINGADPNTFKPFENVCGGVDKKSIYYGCPNLGVYELNIPITSKFEFIPKEDSFWNSPNHYVLVDNKYFDIKYELNKGYFIDFQETISKDEILKTKK